MYVCAGSIYLQEHEFVTQGVASTAGASVAIRGMRPHAVEDSAYGRSLIASYPGGAVLRSSEGTVYGRSLVVSYPGDTALSAKCTTPVSG